MSSAPVGFDAKAAAAASGEAGKLEHAYLQLYEPSTDGSLSKPGPALDRIKFQFNPKELTLAKSASWARQTGTGNERSGPPQYNGPQPSTLTLEMFFDASEKQSDVVVKSVERLFACCVPTTASHQNKKDSPPWVIFRWGGLTGFLAYIGSVQAKYTRFTTTGLPIRAVCTVTLSELAGEAPRQNPTSGSPVPRRVHTLVEGDTLAAIAYKEYGTPALWRELAEVNGIDDPFRLRPGRSVLLPNLTELGGANVARAGRPLEEVARAAR